MIFNEIVKKVGGDIKYANPTSTSVYGTRTLWLNGITHKPFGIIWLERKTNVYFLGYLEDANGNEVLNRLNAGTYNDYTVTVTYNETNQRVEIGFPIDWSTNPSRTEVYCYYIE